MTKEEFEQLVIEGIEALPEKFRKRLQNVAVVVEDDVSPAMRKEQSLSAHDTLLGFYRGVPQSMRGAGYGIGPTFPDVITIYRNPIEDAAAGNPEKIRELVYETVWHEVGHYFGLDEGEVRRRERLRRKKQKE